MMALPAKVPPNSYVLGFHVFHLQKWLVFGVLDQRESPSCTDVNALTHATFSFVEDLGKPPNSALERLALATSQRSPLMASPFQALVLRGPFNELDVGDFYANSSSFSTACRKASEQLSLHVTNSRSFPSRFAGEFSVTTSAGTFRFLCAR
jgi:hypothetical protein